MDFSKIQVKRKSYLGALQILALLTATGLASRQASGDVVQDPGTQEGVVGVEKRPDFLMGSIGDSITAGFDSRRPGPNREINWSTGTRNASKVNSHVWRLRKAMPEKTVGAVNLAISGSKAADVVEQAAKLAVQRPDYVTVLVGANDVCAWPDEHRIALQAYENDMRKTLDLLVASNPDVRIMVSAVPNMPLLQKIGVANNCQAKWSVLKICKPLLAADRTEDQRKAFAARWIDMNQVLARVSADYPRHVRFASSVAEPVFHHGHLSPYDCFHPNTAGQDFLAEKTWEDVDGDHWFQ
ncbi:MAG: hypothetical protein RIQ81_2097 [Pseudomonadota bacterium]